MLVVLRIALVRSDIGVFLNDPGPRLAGTIEKDAFTSLLCPSLGLAARADASPPPEGKRRPRYRVHDPGYGMRFWGATPRSTHALKREILPNHCRGGEGGDLRDIIGGGNLH